MLVKICGITNLQDALLALERGADFVGIMLTSGDELSISDVQAREIIRGLKDNRSKVVGVFDDKNLSKVAVRARALNLFSVQVFAPKHQKDLSHLHPFRLFLTIRVTSNGEYIAPNYFLDNRSYWIYDHCIPGQGHCFDWTQFEPKDNHPFFLAGGLKSENIQKALNCVKPAGLDLCSSLCATNRKRKDAQKVEVFLQKVCQACV